MRKPQSLPDVFAELAWCADNLATGQEFVGVEYSELRDHLATCETAVEQLQEVIGKIEDALEVVAAEDAVWHCQNFVE